MALKVGTLYQEITLEDAKFRAGLERAHGQVKGFGGSLTGLAGKIGAGLGIYTLLSGAIGGVGDAITSTITSGIAYQDQLNTLRAVSGASAAQMTALSQRAMALGNDLSLPATSAQDAATAMTELVKSGLSVQDAMDAAKGVLQLAAAATVDEGTAATFTADALNAYHLKGKDAVMVADLLAGAANASSGEITDMAASLQQAGAVFASSHVPIQTTVALIAELANAGIRGSDAGTSLKSMMLALQTPTAQQAKLMKQLDLNLYDAHGNMRDFRDIIKDTQGPLSKLTQAQRDQMLGTIFGSDAVRAANIIFGQGADALDKMTTAVTKQGASADVANAKSQGLGGAWRGLQSELETLQLELFEKASPALEGFVKGLSEALPAAIEMGRKALKSDFATEFSKNFQKALKDSQPQIDQLKQAFGDLGSSMKNLVRSEAFASFVAAMTVLLPAAMKPTLAGLILMVDQFRFTASAMVGLGQVMWDVSQGNWKAAQEDMSRTVQTESDNQKRIVTDTQTFLAASAAATSDDVTREYNRMKDQTLIAMNGIEQGGVLSATEARIAMNQQARQTGDEFTANMAEGLRAGGTRVSDEADRITGDAVARAHDEAANSRTVGAFLAQGIAFGLADNAGFISTAAVAATRNAVNEARAAAMAQAAAPAATSSPGRVTGHALGGIIPGFPGGGILPGYSPGRDSVLAMLSPGESVLRPEATRLLGAPLIDRLNSIRSAGTASIRPGEGRHYSLSVTGATLQPLDEGRLVQLLREHSLLHG